MTQETKESGIKWVGKVPRFWEFKKLKFTSTLAGRIGWQGLTSEEYRDEGVHLVTGTDFRGGVVDWDKCVRISEQRWAEAAQVQIAEADLLITKDGTVGKVAVCRDLPGKASLNSGVMVIRQRRDFSSRFLYWLLQSPVFWGWFNDINAGSSTITHLYQADLYNFGFYLPESLEMQERIATVLDAEIAKIDLATDMLQRELEILEQFRKSVIHEVVTKGLDPSVKLKASGVGWIGDIPAHWKISRLKDCLQIYNGKEVMDEQGMIPVYGSGGQFKLTSRALFDGESILFGRKGTIDRPLMVTGKFWTVDTMFYSVKKSCDDLRYLYHVALCLDYKSVQSGSTLPSMTQTALGGLYIPRPSVSEQFQIAKFLEIKLASIDRVRQMKKEQLELLRKHRQSLIFEYVTGKRRITETM